MKTLRHLPAFAVVAGFVLWLASCSDDRHAKPEYTTVALAEAQKEHARFVVQVAERDLGFYRLAVDDHFLRARGAVRKTLEADAVAIKDALSLAKEAEQGNRNSSDRFTVTELERVRDAIASILAKPEPVTEQSARMNIPEKKP
jgi:hypothetical protein